MNPILTATLRRHWPLVSAVALVALFWLTHVVIFRPAADRYEHALHKAADLGISIDASGTLQMLPPRVFALVADNAMPSAEAQDLGNSGVLTTRMLEDFTEKLHHHGMEVLATEPGAVTQESKFVQIRAFLRVKGRYGSLVEVLDELAGGHQLISIDRLTLATDASGQEILNLWVSRLHLKQDHKP